MIRSLFRKLLPVGAALLAARMGRRHETVPGAIQGGAAVPTPSNQIVSHSGTRSAFGAVASSALAEAFLPKQTSVLGKMLVAALPVAAARYLRK